MASPSSMLLTLCLFAHAFATHALPFRKSVTRSSGVEVANSRVEQVFKAEDDGYQTIAYAVTYHGKHVVVEDPLCTTDYAIGDKVYFLVMRHDMTKDDADGKKLLSFMVR